jgi:hypothetical protein
VIALDLVECGKQHAGHKCLIDVSGHTPMSVCLTYRHDLLCQWLQWTLFHCGMDLQTICNPGSHRGFHSARSQQFASK